MSTDDAKNALLAASNDAEAAYSRAAKACEALEAELPPGRPRFGFVHVPGGTNRFPPEPPWDEETIRLRGLLTFMRSARSRQRRLVDELRKLAGNL